MATTLLYFLRWILHGSITPWQTVIMATILLHFLRWIPRDSSILWQVTTMDVAPPPATDSTWYVLVIAMIPLHYSSQQTPPDRRQPTTRRLQTSLSVCCSLRL